MTQLALVRLVTAGNREARRRLAGIAAGVMVGVALFLLLFGASQGFEDRNLRSTWTNLSTDSGTPLTPETAALGTGEAAVSSLLDRYQGRTIQGLRIATSADSTIRIPGADVVPGPGEYLASPALADLIDSAPESVLADRYGTRVGTISEEGLEGPDSLVLVEGTNVEDLLVSNDSAVTMVVTELVGFDSWSVIYRAIAVIGAIAVLTPVLLLIAIVTDLGAAQRAERFATLRLVGATPRQVARIGAIETGLTTAVGALLGVGLYYATVPVASLLRIGSSRFYPTDLAVPVQAIAGVVLLTALAAGVVAGWRIRRASIGPLGASRERLEPVPRALALTPLVGGLLLLGAGVLQDQIDAGAPELTAIVGFALTALGLLAAGPLLTWWVAQRGLSVARTAAQVIAFSRIVGHPRSAFRAVAGMVIATFTVTVFAVTISATAQVDAVSTADGRLSTSTLFASLSTGTDSAQLLPQLDALDSDPAVTGTAVALATETGKLLLSADDAATLGINLDGITTAQVLVNAGYLVNDPPAPEAVAEFDQPSSSSSILLVTTDGTPEGIERARTAMIRSDLAFTQTPTTRSDNAAFGSVTMEVQFAALAYLGILLAAALSTVSLAVSTIVALLHRKRLFGLLKLIGMPSQTIRGIVAWETTIPVVTVLALSIGLGWFAAWAIVGALSQRQIAWPSPGYYAVIAGCLALVLLATITSGRAAKHLTADTVTRFE